MTASLVSQAGLADLLAFLRNDPARYQPILHDNADPNSSVDVPVSWLLVCVHGGLGLVNDPPDEKQRKAAEAWHKKSDDEKRDFLRSSCDAAAYAAFKAQGLSAVEISLYSRLGVQAKQVGQHTAALFKAAAADPTIQRLLTNNITQAQRSADPQLCEVADRVKTLLQQPDDKAQLVCSKFDAVNPPAGELSRFAAASIVCRNDLTAAMSLSLLLAILRCAGSPSCLCAGIPRCLCAGCHVACAGLHVVANARTDLAASARVVTLPARAPLAACCAEEPRCHSRVASVFCCRHAAWSKSMHAIARYQRATAGTRCRC